MALDRFARQINATEFAYGVNPNVGPIMVLSGPAASGSGTLILAFGYIVLSDGTGVNPLATNAPIAVGTGSTYEVVTPSAVSASTPLIYASCTVTATFSSIHGNGDQISSGTYGLQEAINYANSIGGGTVIVDSAWTKMGGTTTILNAATLPANGSVQILDNRAGSGSVANTLTVLVPNAQVLTLFSVGVPLIPAPGAGNVVQVERLWVEQVALTAAFAAGGAITAAYGTQAAQTAATGTIAATVFTGGAGTTNQIGTALAVAPANGNSSVLLNKAVGLYAATADFTTGGGSGIVKITYRILTGF